MEVGLGPTFVQCPLREREQCSIPGRDMNSLYTSLTSSVSLTYRARGKGVTWVQPQGVKSAIRANTAASKDLLHAHIKDSGLTQSGISDYSGQISSDLC